MYPTLDFVKLQLFDVILNVIIDYNTLSKQHGFLSLLRETYTKEKNKYNADNSMKY